jgi:hypothetical protein
METISKVNRDEPAAQKSQPPSQIAALLYWFKCVFDYIGGSREEPPAGIPFLGSPLWFGLWWGLLIGLILLFCGQTSKFIYIDF